MNELTTDQINLLTASKKYLSEGNADKSAEYAERLLNEAPDHPETLLLLAEINFHIQSYEVGVQVLGAAVQSYPNIPVLFERLGYGCIRLGLYDKAQEYLQRSLHLNPRSITSALFLATVIEKLGDKQGAIKLYEQFAPDINSADIYCHLGAYYYDLDASKSVDYYRRALILKDESNEIRVNLAASIYKLITTDFSLNHQDYRVLMSESSKCLAMSDSSSFSEELKKRYYLTSSNFLTLNGDIKQALSYLDKSEKEFGLTNELLNNKALKCLMLRRFEQGFELYKQAKRVSQQDLGLESKLVSKSDAPEWKGEELRNKCILVTSEQGVGDQILHWQHLLDERFKEASVILTCNAKLVNLARQSFANIEVRSDIEPLSSNDIQKIDFQVSLIDICSLLYKSFDEIKPVNSYLKADQISKSALKDKYNKIAKGRPLIGISWASFAPSGAVKSASLEELKLLLRDKRYCFVSIQYNADRADVESWCVKNGVELYVDDIEPFDDFDSATEQIAALDAVVSISNACIHVAGGLGKPVYLMLPKKPMWHWFSEGESCLWYDSVKIYRQKSLGDWESVVSNVERDLSDKFEVE